MKIVSKLILILIIVVPIIVCVATLNKVWDDEEFVDNINSGIEDSGDINNNIIVSIDDVSGDINEISSNKSGEQDIGDAGVQTTKLIDAKVAISVANVYSEPNENSEIVATLEKHIEVIAQKYSTGWSRVTNDTLSGWMRTENLTFPEGTTSLSQDSVKIGKIKADPYLNVRASANASADVITTIPNGTEIAIKEEVSGWYKVTYASATGWVSAAYVEVK